MNIIERFNKKQGQGLVEYALILGLIAVVTAAVIVGLGTKTSNKLTAVSAQLN
ncbi:MAG: Flp family type IVb pilin [Verrucomicrobiae bacterium]|nr:Flp family type IVb pilin [Verrucomicrobiae bacterium]